MNSLEAKKILAACRPGGRDAADPRMAEAFRQLDRDPALAQWFAEQQSFDAALSAAVREVPVPRDLNDSLLAERKVIRVPLWRDGRARAALAASVLLLGALGVFYIRRGPATFADYRNQLIDNSWGANRHLDLESPDVKAIRRWLAARDADANFTVPSALSGLPLRGCRLLETRGHKAALLCFTDGPRHLHLFVTDRDGFADAPPEGQPDFESCGGWKTASWRQGGTTYILTGMKNLAFVKKFRKGGHWLMTS